MTTRRLLIVFALLASGVPLAAAQTVGTDDGAEEGEPNASASASASITPSASASAHHAIQQRDGMFLLPAARFTMGSNDPKVAPNEKPAHEVSVSSFWIDRTEVTVAAYRACVSTAQKCAPPQRSSALCTYDAGDEAMPVNCVRWQDADAYCRANGKRLPRETEWEFAARGTTMARFPWGGTPSCLYAATLLHDATGRSCTGRHPSHVGNYPAGASPFGVLDMSGNVEEWTADWYVEREAPGLRPSSGAAHVLRGGGWLSRPIDSRTSSRNWGSALEAGPNVGFRCARDP